MVNNKIVKSLRQKLNDNYNEKFDIGADQKNVSALLNSHNNNLEEQSILGLDCTIDTWTDSQGNTHILKKYFDYCNSNEVSDKGHYYTYGIDYRKTNKSEISFGEEEVIFDKSPSDSVKIEEENNVICLSFINKTDRLTYDFDESEDNGSCCLDFAPSWRLLEEEQLKFRPNKNVQKDEDPETYISQDNVSNPDKQISVKEVYQGITLGDNPKTFTKTIISDNGNAIDIFSAIVTANTQEEDTSNGN